MGIGNLESVLRAYAARRRRRPDRRAGRATASSPTPQRLLRLRSRLPPRGLRAAEPASATSPSHYLWKVLASEQILRPLPRRPRPARRDRRAGDRQGDAGGGLSPRERDRGLRRRPTTIADALDDGELVPLPDRARCSAGSPTSDIGELAGELDQAPELYRALRPEALATLTYLAGLVREQSGAATPLQVTSAVRDRDYQDLLVRRTPRRPPSTRCTRPAGRSTSAATTSRRRRREAFQYVLDRLRSLGAARLRGRARRDPRHRLEPRRELLDELISAG